MKTGYPTMRRASRLAVIFLGLMTAVSLSGADAEDAPAESGKEPKGATTIVVEHPIARAHQAAVNALAVIGCKIRKNQSTYLEGKRSNKLGLVVGSGGETIKIWLTADGDNKTSVKIATAKSMVGYAGQRSWNAAVVEEINKDLAGAAAPAAPAPAANP